MEKLREEFVQAASGEKISKLCREFEISRSTAYKWMKRAQAGESMSNQSHRPKRIANRLAAHVEEKVLEMRTENPGWGGKTIHAVLQREGYPVLPCVKTCDNILKRYGRIDPDESAKHKPISDSRRNNATRCGRWISRVIFLSKATVVAIF